jgi:rhodanese-related sulfurtransferase
MSTVKAVSAQRAMQLKQEGALFIDVREPAEFNNQHIFDAKLLPVGKIDAESLEQFDAQTIVIYCQKGIRGEKACKRIQQHKPSLNVFNLTGGIVAWQQEGLDTTKNSATTLNLDQQVKGIISTAMLLFCLLAVFVNSHFVWGAVAIGIGLIFAGLGGFARVIALAPWNR